MKKIKFIDFTDEQFEVDVSDFFKITVDEVVECYPKFKVLADRKGLKNYTLYVGKFELGIQDIGRSFVTLADPIKDKHGAYLQWDLNPLFRGLFNIEIYSGTILYKIIRKLKRKSKEIAFHGINGGNVSGMGTFIILATMYYLKHKKLDKRLNSIYFTILVKEGPSFWSRFLGKKPFPGNYLVDEDCAAMNFSKFNKLVNKNWK